jgi:hypothetical protein
LAEATGGISGVLAGAGIGSAAGPVGTLIGGIAGAIGGWWAGRAVSEAASTLTHEDDSHYRSHYDTERTTRPADRAYDDVRGAYYLGQVASHNPNFRARQFTEVEPELERGWASFADKYGTWKTVRPYAAEGFTRGRAKLDDSARRGSADQEARTDGERADGRA